MIHVIGFSTRFIAYLLRLFRSSKGSSIPRTPDTSLESKTNGNGSALDDLATQALTTIFGMDAEGRIKKEKARNVVAKLGLIGGEEKENDFELPDTLEDDALQMEEVMGGADEDSLKRMEMLRRAFTVFDKDGDGYISAMEVKRVLECLGLGNGWGMGEFEKMVEMADLNFDGKVDFSEFELMMGEKISSVY